MGLNFKKWIVDNISVFSWLWQSKWWGHLKEGFLFDLSFQGIQSTVARKALWKEKEVAVHTIPTVKKQGEINVGIQITFSFLLNIGLLPPWNTATNI